MELEPGVSYNLQHIYDRVGNRLVKNDDGALTTFTYDVANQLVTSLEAVGMTSYTYDAAGNQRLMVAPVNARTTSVWDDENRQARVLLPDGKITTSTYRFDGLRYQKQDSSGTTRLIYDELNYLQETDIANAVKAQYTNTPNAFGNLVSSASYFSGNWSSKFHLFDVVGSTSLLLSDDQSTTDSYQYDAFGNQLAIAGTTANPFRYIGEVGYYFDMDCNSYYVRARYYSPSIIRWLSVDPMPFLNGDNLYLAYFAPNDADPTGLWVPPDWEGRVDTCKKMLWAAVAAGGLLFNMPCAAELLRLFLSAKMKGKKHCPESCLKALNDPALDIGQLVVDSFPKDPPPSARCFSSGRFDLPDFEYKHKFEGKTDLMYAFGHASLFGKEGACSWNCNSAKRVAVGNNRRCCCDCTADCGFVVTLGDYYDFCSSLEKPKPGEKPSTTRALFECGCIIETFNRQTKGHGNIFTVVCPLQDKRGSFAFKRCT